MNRLGYSADLLEERNDKRLGYSDEHEHGNCIIHSNVCPIRGLSNNRNESNLSIGIANDIIHVGIIDYDWIRVLQHVLVLQHRV